MATHGVPRASRARTEEQKAQELDKIGKYRGLENQLRSHVAKDDYSAEVFQLTSRILKLNPEYYTVWNVRRRTLLRGMLSARPTEAADPAAENDLEVLQSELGFTIPLLLESPKCYWIWNYRAWILQQATERLETPKARRVWEEELGLAAKMLTKDRRNFHAWGYRRHVVGRLESAQLEGESMVEAEFEYTSRMIHVDLSNFSAWHNRSKLIPRLLEGRKAGDQERRAFFDQELSMVNEALNVGPEDQSLWFYHQFLMLSLTDPSAHANLTPNLLIEDRVAYLRREIDEISDFLEDYDDIKWIYEALFEYTQSLCRLEGREPQDEERERLGAWLGRLRALDPMHNGRWDDLEVELGLGHPRGS